MNTDDFYVTLTSNSSTDIFSSNKTSSFQVRLAQELHLSNHRLAITDIIFPSRINNVTRGNNKITYGFEYTYVNKLFSKPITKTCEIPYGFYNSVKEIVDLFNKQFRETDAKPTFDMLEIKDEKVYFTTAFKKDLKSEATMHAKKYYLEETKMALIIQIENRLAWIMGYHSNLNVYSQTPRNHAIIEGVPQNMYIYCDIAEYQMIGCTVAPILKVLPLSGKRDGDERTRYDFPNRNYMHLRKKMFHTIQIECRDEQANLVSFEDDHNLVLTLHFLKIKD